MICHWRNMKMIREILVGLDRRFGRSKKKMVLRPRMYKRKGEKDGNE